MASVSPPASESGSLDDKSRKTDGDLLQRPASAEAKDTEELAPGGGKLTPNTSVDEVKAPGIFGRVKEEVDAIAESINEDRLNRKSSRNVGCFSWLGLGGFHKHNQTQ